MILFFIPNFHTEFYTFNKVIDCRNKLYDEECFLSSTKMQKSLKWSKQSFQNETVFGKGFC